MVRSFLSPLGVVVAQRYVDKYSVWIADSSRNGGYDFIFGSVIDIVDEVTLLSPDDIK